MPEEFQQGTTDDLDPVGPGEANLFVVPQQTDRPKSQPRVKAEQRSLFGGVQTLSATDRKRVDRDVEALREVIGGTGPKQYDLIWVNFADLDIEGIEEEGLTAGAANMLASYETLGLMEDPIVDMLPDGRKYVVAGRRRVITVMLSGEKGMMVKSPIGGYTAEESALATFVENNSREAAWGRDVCKIRWFYQERAMAPDKIERLFASASHKTKTAVRPLVNIALLPAALFDLVSCGRMTQETAKAICRLTETQRQQLALKAADGEAITMADIRKAKEVGAADTLNDLVKLFDDDAVDNGEFDLRQTVDAINAIVGKIRRSGHHNAPAIATMLVAAMTELTSRKK